jgi:ubiquinone/menaquinone biosynthesis C-methylase UbiE
VTHANEHYLKLLESSLPPPGHPNRDEWRQYAVDGPSRLRPHVDELVASMRTQGRLLDVGCGDGGACAAATAAGVPVAMVDLHLGALRRASTRALDAGVVCGDGESLPFADESFSAALLNDVIEHVADPGLTLREIHRVLRPGAVLRLTTVHRFALRNLRADPHWGLFGITVLPIPVARTYVERIRRRGTSFDVYRLFTRRSLVTLLQDCGFTVKRDPRQSAIPPTVVVLDAERQG